MRPWDVRDRMRYIHNSMGATSYMSADGVQFIEGGYEGTVAHDDQGVEYVISEEVTTTAEALDNQHLQVD